MRVMNMIQIGIIGCGAISSVYAEAIKEIPEARIKSCCDIEKEKRETFADQNQCTGFENYQEMIEDDDLDIVIVATPHYLHKQMTLDAVKAKKNVICEKPIALNVSEATEVLKGVTQSNIFYSVTYQNRFNETFLKLKKILNEQCFGQLKGIKCELTWHREQEYYSSGSWRGKKATEGGGVLINQAIHTLDAITWLIDKPYKVKGKVMNFLLDEVIEVEDTAIAVGKLRDETPILIYTTNNYSSNPNPVIIFDFEEATIYLSKDELKINDQIISTEQNYIRDGKKYWGNGHKTFLQTFINKVNGKEDPLIEFLPMMDGLDYLQIVCGIYDSSRLNQWVEI